MQLPYWWQLWVIWSPLPSPHLPTLANLWHPQWSSKFWSLPTKPSMVWDGWLRRMHFPKLIQKWDQILPDNAHFQIATSMEARKSTRSWAFLVVAPALWNQLPVELRPASSFLTFQRLWLHPHLNFSLLHAWPIFNRYFLHFVVWCFLVVLVLFNLWIYHSLYHVLILLH